MSLLHFFTLTYPATVAECREVEIELKSAFTALGRPHDKVLVVSQMTHTGSVDIGDDQ